MTEENRLGPFATGTYNGQAVGKVTAEERIGMVRGFDREQCEEALRVDGLQATVRKAVERRLRALVKPAPAPAPARMDYDPNLTSSGRMARQTVRLTFGLWRYRTQAEVVVGGNCTGLSVIQAAVSMVYDELPYTLVRHETLDAEEACARIELRDPDGTVLTVEDHEFKGELWLEEMLIAAEITAIEPGVRA